MKLEECISEADLRAYLRCPYSYYLKKSGLTHIPRSIAAAEAIFFSQQRRYLFNLRDPDVKRLFPFQHRAGPRLKTAEMMGAEELPLFLAYSSPEKFGGALFGDWCRIAKEGSYANEELALNYKGQDFWAGKNLRTAGENYYNFVLQQGAPILGFIDREVTFPFKDLILRVKFPELRPGIIDEPGLWGHGAESPDEKTLDLAKSISITLKLLAYCTLAQEQFYQRKWKTPSDITTLDPRILYRHTNLISGNSTITSRSESDLADLLKVLERFNDGVSRERYSPNHRHCQACMYNVIGLDGKVVCKERRPGITPAAPKYYFVKSRFFVESRRDGNIIYLSGEVEKGVVEKRGEALPLEERNRKWVAESMLPLVDKGSHYEVSSSYRCIMPGFEEGVIKEMERQLEGLPKVVVHTIDPYLAKNASDLLQKLGYVNGVKRFEPKPLL
jgi:hypothetical protein